MTKDQAVEIYTDGACIGNPGPGGWGAVLRYGSHEKELYGSESGTTTNNRMELLAPIRALRELTRRSVVRVYTDSTYVKDGITSWLPKWKVNGWRTTAKQPVKNVDLWLELDEATALHEVQWYWVKGHAAIRRMSGRTGWRVAAPKRRRKTEKHEKQSDAAQAQSHIGAGNDARPPPAVAEVRTTAVPT